MSEHDEPRHLRPVPKPPARTQRNEALSGLREALEQIEGRLQLDGGILELVEQYRVLRGVLQADDAICDVDSVREDIRRLIEKLLDLDAHLAALAHLRRRLSCE